MQQRVGRGKAGLEEAGGDAVFIAKALGDIARAKGMAQVAKDAGLSRESLYRYFPVSGAQTSTPSSRLSERWD